MRGIRDWQHGRVPPQSRARKKRGPRAAERIEVVAQLEEAAALFALQAIAERVDGAAVDADQILRERSRHRRPNRSWTSDTISSTRCRSVCSASARWRALAPMARAS